MALTDYSIDTSGTPLEARRRQAYAEALMKAGGDSSPIQSPWQGLNRLAQGLIGGYQSGQDSREEAQGRKSGQAVSDAYVKSLMGNGTIPASLSAAQPPTSNAAASGVAPDTSGKIYGNDEPSPLDPPSGDDRKNLQMMVLGEAGNEPQQGKVGVASVARTRAVDGGYGGDTPTGVVTAPNQFEPFNTQEGRSRMARALMDPKQLASANDAIDQAYGTGKYVSAGPNDPTEGMTHFYSPAGQAAMGRPAPAWAGGDSVTIGGHVFNSPDDKAPPNAQMAQGQLPNQQQVMSAGGQPDVNAQRRAALAAALDPNVPAATRAIAKSDYDRLSKPEPIQSIGSGYIVQNGQVKKAYEPEDKTPTSKLEYDVYAKDEQAAGRKPIPYGQFTGKVDAPASAVNNSGLSGQAFLDTLDPGRAEIIKQMVEGRMAPPTGAALRSDKVMSLMSDAARYDPEFDSTKWGARVAGSKDFASGKSAEMVRSAGQTVHHIDTLIGNMKELGNTSIKPYNYLKNTANDAMGGAEPNNFLLTGHAVAEELSKVFKGANLSDSEVRVWEHALSPNMSPEQQKGAVKGAMTLLNGSLHMLEEKRLNSMGKVAADKAGPLLKPEEQKIYDKAMSWANSDKTRNGEIPKLDVGQSHTDGDVTITKISH